jgi:hypothetical protein
MNKRARKRVRVIQSTRDILEARSEITLGSLVYELDRRLPYTLDRVCVSMILARAAGIVAVKHKVEGCRFTVYTLGDDS